MERNGFGVLSYHGSLSGERVGGEAVSVLANVMHALL